MSMVVEIRECRIWPCTSLEFAPASIIHVAREVRRQRQFTNPSFTGRKFDERQHFSELCERFEANAVDGANVTLKDATFMKIICDAYFLRAAKQKLERRQPGMSEDLRPRENGKENADRTV
jgi:hypothetical protein